MNNKKIVFGILLFCAISFIAYTFANPLEEKEDGGRLVPGSNTLQDTGNNDEDNETNKPEEENLTDDTQTATETIIVPPSITITNPTANTSNNGTRPSGNTGNTGSSSGNTGTSGGNTGNNPGDNTGNTGNKPEDNTGNTGNNPGDNTGNIGNNPGDNTGNTGNNPGDNTENTGNNPGDNTGNTGNNPGDNTGNTGTSGGNTGTGTSENPKPINPEPVKPKYSTVTTTTSGVVLKQNGNKVSLTGTVPEIGYTGAGKVTLVFTSPEVYSEEVLNGLEVIIGYNGKVYHRSDLKNMNTGNGTSKAKIVINHGVAFPGNYDITLYWGTGEKITYTINFNINVELND